MGWLFLALTLLLSACSPAADPMQRAIALQAQAQFEASIAPLVEQVESGDRSPELMYRYGLALSMTGRTSQALWPLQEAMQDPNWFAPAAMRLASDSYRTGNFDIAIARASEILERHPDRLDALRVRALARLQSRRDYEGALEDTERVLEADSERRDMAGPRIVALLGLGRIEEAEEALLAFEGEQQELEGQQTRRDGSGNPALACTVRGKFSAEKGDLDAAREIYSRCLESFPADHGVVNETLEFFQQTGEESRIDEILQAAHEAAPADRGFRIAWARRLQLSGKPDEAEQVLRDATQAPHGGVDAWRDLAGYLMQEGRTDAGIEAYERALAASPLPDPELQLAHAEALINTGRLDAALEAAERIRVSSHRAFARGRVYRERGEHVAAQKAFDEGIRLWPDNAVARYYAARTAEALGQFDRAIEEYRYALRVDPNAADTRLRLARLHLASGYPGDAVYVLRYQGLGGEPPRRSVESALIELEALALAGDLDETPKDLLDTVQNPESWGAAVAAVARGTRRRLGPAPAVEIVRSADRLDLSHPRSAPALRGLVADLSELGEGEAAVELGERAFEARPVAVFAEILGEALTLSDRSEEARAAFERALALEPGRPRALMGLARLLAAAGERERALSLYEAIEADALEDGEPLRAHAELLALAGRIEEADARLRSALERDPYDGRSALQLAQLRLEGGAAGESTQALVRRAARFGGGSEARELLARLPSP